MNTNTQNMRLKRMSNKQLNYLLDYYKKLLNSPNLKSKGRMQIKLQIARLEQEAKKRNAVYAD